jgi:hypothetical protein
VARIPCLRGACVFFILSAALVAADTPKRSEKMLSHPVPLAIAKPKLLMDAINEPAFLWLNQTLRGRPTDNRTWQHLSDEAQLVAENGNLLLLRPPQGKKAGAWLDRATALRLQAVHLNQAADKHDFPAARKALIALTGTCTRCHKQFGVPVDVTAFDVQPIRPTKVTTNVTPPPMPPPVPQPPPPPPVPPPPKR